MPKTPEDIVKDKIVKYLDSYTKHYLKYFRRDAIGFNYKEGLPDLWLVCNGKHLEIETKAPGGFPSGQQLKWEQKFLKCGCLYWRGDSPEEFIKFFESEFD